MHFYYTFSRGTPKVGYAMTKKEPVDVSRFDSSGGILQEGEKVEVLTLLEVGCHFSYIAQKLNRSLTTISNTRKADPEFDKLCERTHWDAQCGKIEKSMGKLANGKAKKITHTYVAEYDKEGNPILDEKGRQKRRLKTTKEEIFQPSSHAAQLLLKAKKPDEYERGQKLEVSAGNLDQLDPVQLAEDLKKTLASSTTPPATI